MSYFDQYSGIAGGYADANGLNRSVFYGLIQTESSWNPYADAPGSSAYGFTQLLAGTAKGLGVDRFNPTQNLKGGAQYLGDLVKKYGGDYTKALAAYHDGPGAIGLHGGFDYAKKVLDNAKKFLGGGDTGKLVEMGANAILPGSGAVLDGLGLTSDCGWICQLQNWIKDSGFFQRIGLAILAFIIIAAAFYLMNRTEINAAVSKAALAA